MTKPEWRECAFAGKPVQHIPVMGVLANPDREHTRPCPDVHGHEVCPKTCATCPVPEQKCKSDLWDKCGPALVEAVLAFDEFLSSGVVQAAFTLQGAHGGCKPWRKDGKLIGEILDAALALVPKGADDAT